MCLSVTRVMGAYDELRHQVGTPVYAPFVIITLTQFSLSSHVSQAHNRILLFL